jgi:hypothetical protein
MHLVLMAKMAPLARKATPAMKVAGHKMAPVVMAAGKAFAENRAERYRAGAERAAKDAVVAATDGQGLVQSLRDAPHSNENQVAQAKTAVSYLVLQAKTATEAARIAAERYAAWHDAIDFSSKQAALIALWQVHEKASNASREARRQYEALRSLLDSASPLTA